MYKNKKFKKWIRNREQKLLKNVEKQDKLKKRLDLLTKEFKKIKDELPTFDMIIKFDKDIYISELMGVGKRYLLKNKSITFVNGLAEVEYKDVNIAGISPLIEKRTVSILELADYI